MKIEIRADGAHISGYVNVTGKRSRPVITPHGKVIEEIGTYNPLTDPATVNVDADRAQEWIKKGAQPTDTVRGILKKAGVLN